MINSKDIAKEAMKKLEDGRDPREVSDELLDFLEKNHSSKILPNILKNLEVLNRQKENKETVIVTAPHEPTEELLSAIKDLVGESKSKLKIKIDPNLLGGAMIKNGYKLSNLSIKNNVESLRKSLSQK